MRTARLLGALCALATVASAGTAHALDLDLKWSGFVSTDIRYRLLGEEVKSLFPSQYNLLRNGFSRNENRVRGTLSLGLGEHVRAVTDLELVYYGYSDVRDVDSNTLRDRVDPYFLEAHAAYVDLYRILPGLDLRIGRQIVKWGAADQFNPTSNVNTLDLSDPLLFGRALANNMVRADWNPKGDWIVTLVWVPIFRPSQIPRTAPLALKLIDRPAPVQEEYARQTLGLFANIMPPSYIDAVALQPEASLSNSQVAARVSGRVFDQDFSLSYYHGRFGLPSPAWTINRQDGSAEIGLVWPRMDVIGADIAGTIEPLGGIGYWLEGAVTFPQEITYGIYDDKTFGKRTPVTINERGMTEFKEGKRATVVPTTPFLKLTAGIDWSAGEHLYFNLQYLHGFIDEFGAGVVGRLPKSMGDDPRIEQRLGDYFVAGADLKLRGGTVLFRLFGIVKIPSINSGYDPNQENCKDPTKAQLDWRCSRFDSYSFTGVLFPQFVWMPFDATELTLGAFVFLGDRSTKFGDPSTGATEIFAKARFSF